MCGQRLRQSESVADAAQERNEGCAEVANHFPHEGLKLRLIECLGRHGLSPTFNNARYSQAAQLCCCGALTLDLILRPSQLGSWRRPPSSTSRHRIRSIHGESS